MNGIIYLVLICAPALLVTYVISKLPSGNGKRFLSILGLNVLCSFCPWFYPGAVMGLPASVLSAACITYLLRE